ncbi:MAG: efflux RND transporter periplasmic adaptor subunit [Rhodothermales bacterium]|nr:efflux RND transporter periplasmic adaptor subunit [Rhodothermales bacterium]
MNQKKSTNRKLFYLLGGLALLLVVVLVVGALAFGGRSDGIPVETARAEVRTVTQVVTASGKVQPEVEVIISPDVSGEVIQLPIQEGDQVKRGALLARIKPDFYTAQVEQAEANVMQNRAVMEQRRADLLGAEAELKRQQSLFERNVISASAIEQVRTQYAIAKAAFDAAQFSVESSQARLREAREQLGKTALYAPMDGTVSKLNVELGERVVGTSQMAGTEMMRIARLDQMELEVDVNENDVVNVSLGDTSAIEIDAYPEQVFRGVVTEIANSARVTAAGTQEQVTNFPIKIRILDPHNLDARVAEGGAAADLGQELPVVLEDFPRFRPGMSGTVDIFTKSVEDVVSVPIQAVTVRDFNQIREKEDADSTDAMPAVPAMAAEDLRKVIFILEDGEAVVREVETGIADDRFIEIKSGVEAGATVIIGPYRVVSRTLEPGQAVEEDTPGRRRGGPPSS